MFKFSKLLLQLWDTCTELACEVSFKVVAFVAKAD